jgi:hypothetical protein
MDASDLIKALQNTLQGRGRPHMGNVGEDDFLTKKAGIFPRDRQLSSKTFESLPFH